MAISKTLKHLRFIGKGVYSRVYEYDNQKVLKVPYCMNCNEIRILSERRVQSKFIVSWTNVVYQKFPDIVIPTHYHIGGTMLQSRCHGYTIESLENKKAIDRAYKETDILFKEANAICNNLFHEQLDIVDENIENFRFRYDGSVYEWFDPVIPLDVEENCIKCKHLDSSV
jgi:hypothetical protein